MSSQPLPEVQNVPLSIYEPRHWSTMVWIFFKIISQHIQDLVWSFASWLFLGAFFPVKRIKYKGHTICSALFLEVMQLQLTHVPLSFDQLDAACDRSASFDWRTVRHWQSRLGVMHREVHSLQIGCCKCVLVLRLVHNYYQSTISMPTCILQFYRSQAHAVWPLGQEDTDMLIDTLEAIYIGQAGWVVWWWASLGRIRFRIWDPKFERMSI